MRNVGLVGNIAAGKSTLAAALTDAGYVRLSLAGSLKNVAALAYGKIDKSAYYDVEDANGDTRQISGREVLQGVGQSIKSLDRSFWLRAFLRETRLYLDSPLVVDDIRFLFEADALRKDGWLIVGINTPWALRMQRAKALYGREPTAAEQSHESEVEVPLILQQADMIVQGNDESYDIARRVLEKARA